MRRVGRGGRATELLEDRTLLASITVTTGEDIVDAGDGLISLREAITTAQGNGQADVITIAPSVGILRLRLGELVIGTAIDIVGNGAFITTQSLEPPVEPPDLPTPSRVFSLFSNAVTTISNLRISFADSSTSPNPTQGGAIRNSGGQLTLDRVTITESKSEFGGAIYNTGKLVVLNSSIISNAAKTSGGGIYQNASGANTRILNSVLALNSSQDDGGAVANDFGKLSVVSSTIILNGASDDGGGIFAWQDANTSTAINNTIVAGNTGAGSDPSDLHITTDGSNNLGTVTIDNSWANLIGDSNSRGGLTHANRLNQVGNSGAGVRDINTVLISSLFSVGSGIHFSHALIDGSPAIDTGLTTRAKDPGLDGVFFNADDGFVFATDVRGSGFPRVVDSGKNNVDIGAFEFAFPTDLIVDTTEDVDDGDYAPGDLSLREAIRLANARAGKDQITFAPFFSDSSPDTITLGGTHLTLTGELNLVGPGANPLTINADNASRHFQVDAGAVVEISGLTLTGGNGGFEGGAINNDGELTLRGLWLTDNQAQYGGAIDNDSLASGVSLTIVNSTLSGNKATTGTGGAIYSAESLVIINSTVSGNSAAEQGGSLTVEQDSMARIANSTITGNRADFDNDSTASGGGIYTLGSSTVVTLENTIVAGNFVDAGSTSNDIGIQSGTVTGFNNLIGDAGSSGGLSDNKFGNIVGNNGTGVRDINTILNTTLQNNGGRIPTHALLPTSVAVNAGEFTLAKDENGNTLLTDGRGAPFIRFGQGTENGLSFTDIGAYELQPTLIVNTLNDETNDNSTFSLREAIDQANLQHIGSNVGGVTDEISFAFGLNGTMLLGGTQLVIAGNKGAVNLVGPGANLLTIDANNASRHFQVDAGAVVEISGLTLTGGNGGFEGGAINNDGKLTLRGLWLTDNQAEFGGAIDNDSTASSVSVTIVNSTLSGNKATTGTGGAIYSAESLVIINSTISGNSAAHSGGGLTVELDSLARITNSTITGNRADFDNNSAVAKGGGINTLGSSIVVTLENTIVAGNFVDAGSTPSDIGIQSGTVTGFNTLIGDAGSSGGVTNGKNGNIVGINGAGTRPIATILNTTLQNNGGPTLTHALAAGSLAIDNGNTVKAVDQNGAPLTIEQRGSRRVFDGNGDGDLRVDIGAVEAGPIAVNGTLIFEQSNGKWRLGTVSGDKLNWFETGGFGAFQRGFIADFDGDGLLDGMMYNTTNNRFNFLRNKGDGTLAAPVSAGTLSTSVSWEHFMVGDYDGDGRAEVMAQIVSPGPGQGSMRSQDHLGVNRFYISLSTGYAAMATGDFNGDGFDDIVGLIDTVAQDRTNIIPAYSISTPVGRRFTALLSSGQFGQSVTAAGFHDLTVDDFNGDGRDDLAVVNANGQAFTATTVGDPRMASVDVRNFIASAASPNFAPATHPNPLLSGFFDNNSMADLFTIRNTFIPVIALTTLAGNGTPIQVGSIGGGSLGGSNAVIGDFNGDGLDDVIVLATTAQRFLSNGSKFGTGFNFGTVLGGPIGLIGTARTGRVN